jgi:hypothetical protein
MGMQSPNYAKTGVLRHWGCNSWSQAKSFCCKPLFGIIILVQFSLTIPKITDVIELDAPTGNLAQTIHAARQKQRRAAKVQLVNAHLKSDLVKKRLKRFFSDEWNMKKTPAITAYLNKV